jgi:PAS domain S-box-containing protein
LVAYHDETGFAAWVRSAVLSPHMTTSQNMDDGSRFRSLMDTVTDCAIYMLDPDGIVVSWNADAEHITGYSAAEIVGRHFSCFFTEADRLADKPNELLKIADRTGRFEERGWRVRKDGDQFRAHAVAYAIRGPDGRLVGFAKLTRDMTEQNRGDEALQRSEERFRRVVEATPNAMVMIDRAGRIGMVNPQTERVFGYTRAELLGQPMEMLVPERFRGRHPGLRLTFYDDPRTRPMGAGRDLYGLRKDGSEFAVEIGLNPIETDEGTMVLSTIVDIST